MQLFGVFCTLVVAVSAMRKTALDLVGSDLNEADQGSTSLAQGVAALDQDGQLFAAMDRDGNKEISEVEFEKFKEMGRSINTFVQQGSAQDKESNTTKAEQCDYGCTCIGESMKKFAQVCKCECCQFDSTCGDAKGNIVNDRCVWDTANTKGFTFGTSCRPPITGAFKNGINVMKEGWKKLGF